MLTSRLDLEPVPLVRVVAEVNFPADMVLLGVCTPDEMTDWPDGPWILLDCSDPVRRRRLAQRKDPEETEVALQDARKYRALGLPSSDTTEVSLDEVARAVSDMLGGGVV